jgi:P-type conjugative transfer protein TrbJ
MNLKFRVVSSQRGILAAKKALIVPFVASVMALPVKAGIPVIDGTNVVQTTISAVNNVQAVTKQIQQYQTQLQQYENMLKNRRTCGLYLGPGKFNN